MNLIDNLECILVCGQILHRWPSLVKKLLKIFLIYNSRNCKRSPFVSYCNCRVHHKKINVMCPEIQADYKLTEPINEENFRINSKLILLVINFKCASKLLTLNKKVKIIEQ
ncbi:hypothetical protein A9Q81_07565 [Gammaproteobacteria bacterium 42_54_T18]|nr:hypothetical protein A9Q81_07565 [Gammaproteobacteria bacterium 42_54_T18]